MAKKPKVLKGTIAADQYGPYLQELQNSYGNAAVVSGRVIRSLGGKTQYEIEIHFKD